MSNIIVIGAGMVGSAMAIDLVQKHKVTLADLDAQRLKQLSTKFPAIEVMPLDVQDADALQKAIINFDLVICAVPGFLGYLALKHIIEAGKNV
ncbi:MAG TPA: saccharopine dehydrogenase NADP-binding domain-containing protein, partial [Saprospiraceae bacterium]|nr:saccharopine dehydrogenase NADP-binding domain-containing protein [Saprospiraceae bacterium]